jgi:SNF2 family DNA or RNA helicase
LVSQGTVEDRVRQLQAHKKLLFDELLGDLKDVSQKDKFLETVREILS